MNKLVIIVCMCLGLLNSITAQTQLQYQLNQQGNGDCPGSTVTISVSTSVNISTTAVSELISSAATSGGNITNDGGNPVTQRGVCWSSSPNPTTNDNITNNGNGLGSFTSNLSGLTAIATYFIRAYAINGAGTFYGNEISFTTPDIISSSPHTCGAENVHNPNLNYGSLTDQQGNVYKTIVIGNQEWMAENLKTSHYSNGDLIPNITDAAQWDGLSTGALCFYNNNPQSDCPFGKLYNWFSISDSRHVCPVGWHIPSDAEWTNLENFLGGNVVAGGKLKSTSSLWIATDTAIGTTNEIGFSGLPSGARGNSNGAFGPSGSYQFCWSSSESPSNVWFRYMKYDSGYLFRSESDKKNGLSVRCLKD
jgi:uncharacterized protein (TIGR02145 family)